MSQTARTAPADRSPGSSSGPSPGRTGRQLLALLLLGGGVAFALLITGGLASSTPGAAWAADDGLVAAGGGRAIEVSSVSPGVTLPDFADLAAAVGPAVVSVQAATFEGERRSRTLDPFDFFFGPRRRGTPGPEDENGREAPPFRSDSGGSGFVISSNGLIVTNYHVVEGADELTVELGERRYPAEVKGTDPDTDLALLEIDAGRPLDYLRLGDSDALRVGEWIMVIGSPLQLEQTVTVGVVSAKGRSLGVLNSSFENFIQTDAAINFGNSGGPIVNLNGEVVGIATLINYGAENIGFAVPVSTLQQVLPQLREDGRVRRGYLGVQIGEVDFPTAEAFGLAEPTGVLVSQVVAGDPADRAGVEHGDIILEVDGRRVDSTRDLIDYVSGQGPDATVELVLLRDGERLERRVRLAERQAADAVPAAAPERSDEGGIEWLGLRYQDLTRRLRESHDLPGDLEGVLITSVDPRSPLWDEGVRPDGVMNVITELNGEPTRSVEELEAAVAAAPPGSRLRFYIRRFAQGNEGQPVFAFPRVPE